MKWGSIAVSVVFGILVLIVAYETVSFYRVGKEVRAEFHEFQTRVETARLDQQRLQEEMEYYRHPENLEKELRARFHYRKDDEKLIILVPKTEYAR